MFFNSTRMCMMVSAAVLATSVGVSTVWSYLRTAHAALGQSIRDNVPIEFELKRLEQLTEDLIPDIQTNQKVAAQLEAKFDDHFKSE